MFLRPERSLGRWASRQGMKVAVRQTLVAIDAPLAPLRAFRYAHAGLIHNVSPPSEP